MRIGDIEITEINPIPKADIGDEKEVYAFYGLAVFTAQCAEKSLVNFAMGYKLLDETILTQEQWLAIYDELNTKTFGCLLRNIKNRTQLSDDVISHLELSLSKRNWLAHDFFYDFSSHFFDGDGRVEMIKELTKLIELFQIADLIIEKLSLKLWNHFGVTEQWIENELAAQLDEYLKAKKP